jgi:hypothetical protein
MNYTETFNDFSSRVGPMDLALYAGAGLIIWVLFKDKLSPVQKVLGSLVSNIKNMVSNRSVNSSTNLDVIKTVPATTPVVINKEDLFFKLITSWKQTRDLAVLNGCEEAIKVADQMFPHLSPEVCNKKDDTK